MFSKPQNIEKKNNGIFITFKDTNRHGYDFILYFSHELLISFWRSM